MTDHPQAHHGIEAQQVLENPAFTRAMQAVKDQIHRQWLECPVRDREGQLLLLQLAKLADKFDSLLRGAVESGKLAQHRIDIDAERNESGARKLVRRVL
jgi:hypothetical protein